MKKKALLAFWLLCIVLGVYVFFLHPEILKNGLEQSSKTSTYIAYALFLLLGAVRGFTLIPSTYLIVLGMIFFPPFTLLVLVLTGILISSGCVYYFFEHIGLEEVIKSKYSKELTKIENTLRRNELFIVVLWSAAPFLPTDLICYACGMAKVNFKKFLLGVFIGEGITCTLYIYSGHFIIQQLMTLI